jgi:hypothetical protein
MNFLLLYEKNPTTGSRGLPSVFFGYGTQSLEHTNEETSVFYSKDERLAKEFMRLFKVLRSPQFSSPIDLYSPEFLRSRPRDCDVLATFKDGFPRAEILERIADCQRHVTVCTTAWPSLDEFKPQLKAALKRDCKVTFALWEPDDPFVQLRSDTVDDPEDLKSSIEANRIVLKAFDKNKHFKVHWCKGPGSVTIFWIDDLIYFSPYWVGDYASHGVHFLVHAKSSTGQSLIDQLKKMQASASTKTRP